MAFSQTKTKQGFLPFRGVELVDADGRPLPPQAGLPSVRGTALRFGLLTSREVMRLRSAADAPAGAPGDAPAALLAPRRERDITHLGLCTPFTAQGAERSAESLLAFAQGSGPLFGGASGVEDLRAWRCAADAAMLAVLIQEVVNGSRSVGERALSERVSKLRLTHDASGRAFTVFDLNVLLHRGYEDVIADLPFVRRVEQGDGIVYVFAHRRVGEDGRPMATLTALRLPEEISAGELAWLGDALGFDADLVELSHRQLSLESAPDEAVISPGDDYTPELLELADEDRPLLASLVQALIVMHLRGARIDVFQGDGITGYLAFDSLLGWMWHDFSSRLAHVSFAYCMQCGRPFSLEGHRGMARKYCSRACKTRAKNERVRETRERARRRFLEGTPIAQIARTDYADQDPAQAERAIRRDLSSWPHLKHQIEQSICDEGFRGSELLRRCVAERLDVTRLLSVQRLDELRALGGERGLPPRA